MIEIEKSFELFVETLSRLDKRNLELNDEDLSYEIFEELDSEYHTFLHAWTVDVLINGGLVNGVLRPRILTLREDIGEAIKSNPNVSFFRTDSNWKKIRDEANSILKEINSKKFHVK